MKLEDPVEILAYIGASYAKKLSNLDIKTVGEMLHHIPFRFIDFRKQSKISMLQIDDFVTIKGVVTEAKNQYTRNARKIQIFTVSDDTGELEVVWFNQPFLIHSIKVGDEIVVAGQVSWYGRKIAIISPEYEKYTKGIHTGRLLPIYHETSGISSKWLRKRISEIFQKGIDINEFLPSDLLKEENLIGFREAMESVHFPKEESDFEEGKKRLSFNELLLMHLSVLNRKRRWQGNEASYKLNVNDKLIKEFTDSLDFDLTNSQNKAISEIINNLKSEIPMNRLLEGDVGSGKTVVAAAGCFASFTNGYESIVMAPTQILAHQHFNTLKSLFEPFKIKVSLITSNTKQKDIEKADIFVGTHALIHKKLDLETVSLVVIDEQHKFGVEQRNHLVKKVGDKTNIPHVLTMTATPIPRTVAMSIFGDLDLSTLNELPKGRQKITTWLIPPAKRIGAYKWIKEQISKLKVQCYIVCPLIEESESETLQQVKAAKGEYEKLVKIFPSLKVGLLHGRQNMKEKNSILEEFKKGKIDILVTTPVVEVGIDVPNAVIMMIEAAERFGLAQLHQLRGRVGRGNKKSYCLVMSEKESEKSLKRLNALKQTYSGFELAELDLKMRGPGEIFGTKQSGFPELKIASWQDANLIMRTRKAAENLLKSDLLHDAVTKKKTYKS